MIRTTVFVVALMLAGCVVASEHLGNNRRDGFIDAAVPAKPALRWTYQERSAPAILAAETGELLFHESGLGYMAHYPGGS